MLQTGGCHFDKWIVPSERNRPDIVSQDLIELRNYSFSLTRKQANYRSIKRRAQIGSHLQSGGIMIVFNSHF
jgi:hypothetical protein